MLGKHLSRLLNGQNSLSFIQLRGVAMIPPWEYHIRFDIGVGRKVPARDALNAFKRLNNGMWIKNKAGKYRLRYLKKEPYLTESLYATTCTEAECFMLDRMVTPYWLRPKYYPNDVYEPYNVRQGLKTPRMEKDNRTMKRERRKILLEDTTADKYFYDR